MTNKIFALCFFLILSSCSHKPQVSEKESAKLNAFFEELFETRVARYPTWQTYLGRKTNYGLLNNETEAYSKEDHELNVKTLNKLKKVDVSTLDEKTKMSLRILTFQLELDIEGYEWRYHSYPLNQMFGYQSETPSFLINMHQIDSVSDAHDYISRLKEIKRVFDEKLVNIKKQESLGIVPPHFVFEKVIFDSKNIISGQPFDSSKKLSPLLEDFVSKVGKLKIHDSIKKKFRGDAYGALHTSVLPAYKELIAYVEELAKKYPDNHGVWALPNGDKFYNFALKSVTTTSMNADEIHNVGLKEVKRIQEEMLGIMKTVGFKGSLNEFFNHMRGEKYYYPNTEAGRKAYLAEVKTVLASITKKMPELFKTFPKSKLLVKPVEAFREKSAGTAFYSGPSLEGTRPGIYYVNLYKMADNPRYKLEALAYHEAIPGHHMQIALAQEMEGMPKFRRDGGFTAYVEGWGLYSESLPKDIGFYQDPYSDFGRLSMEIWRAARLVVDTGIHSKKWTREQAIAFMSENTPSAKLETIKEIERYFIMPGQATAYKVGMMKFLYLRKMAKDALGDRFDIREFHEVVLGDGALPMGILEEKVNAWIQRLK